MFSRNRSLIGDVFTGTLAGMAGGALASWVMNQYIAAEQQKEQQREAAQRGEHEERGSGGQRQTKAKAEGGQGEGGEADATVKIAQTLSRNLFDHELTESEKKVAGPVVHYAYGTLVGGVYGGVAEMAPVVGAGFGMPFGISLWLLGDEVAIPALKFGPPPTEVSAEKHAGYLAAHLVYGITLDVTRRVMRHVL
jgi:hypothetical protein